MKSLKLSERTFISFLRYLAHLFSVLLIFVVLLLAIGEGFPNLSNLAAREILLTISLLVMLAGLLSAWKWEMIGGSLIIFGFVFFLIVNFVFSKNLNLGFFFILFPLTGLIYLFCCWREKAE